MGKLEDLRTEREMIATKFEFILDQANDHHTTPLDIATIDAYVLEVIHWNKRLDEVYLQTAFLKPSDLDDDKKDYVLLLKSVRQVLVQLRAVRALVMPVATASIPTATSVGNNVRLPKLEIQPFHGNYLEWATFKDSFEAAVHSNASVSKVEKFTYLALLKGEAARYTADLPLTDAHYDQAWKQLHDRYENQRMIAFATLDKFCSQPKSTATSKSVKALIDAANRCIRSMELLNCHMDIHTEQFYIYHIARKLDPGAKDMWEHSLKDNDIIKLADLISFLERHAMALENSAYVASNPKSGSEKKTATVHHTQAATKKCKMGCRDSHPLFKCKEFRGATVEGRRALVKREKLCYTCLLPKHGTCDSPFKCKKCNQQHSYLLHNNAADNHRNDQQNQTMNTQASNNSRADRNYERQQGEHQQSERTSQVFHTQGRSDGSASNNGGSLFYNNSE
ncbi:hypothetical protein Fcan01_28383 [Folsomia candida]|uniref:Uncharacterized protein n=1 Tax=Folsomia candida TaxID=158441 RepID=A0A226CVE6_FOLCA|nr:hypothetical protein Fcan01_28383 [Folsomia candida]